MTSARASVVPASSVRPAIAVLSAFIVPPLYVTGAGYVRQLYSLRVSLGRSSRTPRFRRTSSDDLQAPAYRVPVAEPRHQLLPHRVGVLVEHQRGVRGAHVPVAGLDLLRELARRPADEPGEVACVVRRLLDDAVDVLAVAGHEEIVEQADRRLARIPPQQREDGARRLRAAVKERVGDLRGR